MSEFSKEWYLKDSENGIRIFLTKDDVAYIDLSQEEIEDMLWVLRNPSSNYKISESTKIKMICEKCHQGFKPPYYETEDGDWLCENCFKEGCKHYWKQEGEVSFCVKCLMMKDSKGNEFEAHKVKE